MSYKRKRGSTASYPIVIGGAPRVTYKKRKTTGRAFRPGRDRVGGYYGRYAGRDGELKFHDIDVNDAVIAGGATIQNTGTINIIPQGVEEVQRVGRKCTIRAINWRWQVKMPAATAATSTADEVRLILYMDKQCNGATAASTDILEGASIHSFNNLSNSGRFRILYDHRISLRSAGAAASGAAFVFGEDIRIGSFYKKCDIPLEFDSTTGALTEIRSNNLGIMALSDEGLCELDSSVRLRFSDH